jgi:DNA-binding beta-propeller fold protein YncE
MTSRFPLGVAVLAAFATGTIAAVGPPGPEAPVKVSLTPLSSLKTGAFRTDDPRIAEINAFDPAGQRIYVVNPLTGRLDVIDAGNPASLAPATPSSVNIVAACEAALGPDCPLSPGGEPNSVAIHGRLMAVAVGSPVRTDHGHAVFFELHGAAAPVFLAAVEVGALPDMVTFTADGEYALTANEGEPSLDYSIDPPGSVSIITVAGLGGADAVRHVDFAAFDEPAAHEELERQGVRIFGPGASASQDLEPEYIATDGAKAYVTLQENNALAIIDLAGATVERIVGLGLKNYSIPGPGLDPSDQDSSVNNGINIGNWPVSGMYQPDAVDAFQSSGRTYLVMANEGDAREYDPPGPTVGYVEAIRAGNAAYVLDPAVFPNAAALKANAALQGERRPGQRRRLRPHRRVRRALGVGPR